VASSAFLSARNLDVHFGHFQVLVDVTIQVEEGEVVSIIGANSAGKSTLLRAIAAMVTPSAGTIMFCGKNIGDLRPHEVVANGISLVPEGRRVFSSLTVLENLLIGAYSRRSGEAIGRSLEEVYDLFPILRERSNHMGNDLSGGEQQMLAIGRSLMSKPRLVLLDEISQGLAPLVVKNIYRTVSGISRTGTAVLLVEQDVRRSIRTAQRVYAMMRGRAVHLGVPASISEEDLKNACFGLQ
jgi:branched-chain amino acid transport system ATP-binding protein